jgi:hypothetical protein
MHDRAADGVPRVLQSVVHMDSVAGRLSTVVSLRRHAGIPRNPAIRMMLMHARLSSGVAQQLPVT